jgi:hypothetical protein
MEESDSEGVVWDSRHDANFRNKMIAILEYKKYLGHGNKTMEDTKLPNKTQHMRTN